MGVWVGGGVIEVGDWGCKVGESCLDLGVKMKGGEGLNGGVIRCCKDMGGKVFGVFLCIRVRVGLLGWC